MLHKAIFLATRNATFVALQVARKNSRVTPHFATAIFALEVARKIASYNMAFSRARKNDASDPVKKQKSLQHLNGNTI